MYTPCLRTVWSTVYAQPRCQISGSTGIRTWYIHVTSLIRYEWAIGASNPTLELGRGGGTLQFSLHDLASNYLKDLINCRPNRNSNLYLTSYKITKHDINSSPYRAQRIWNSLLETTRNAPFLPSFITPIKGWNWLPRNSWREAVKNGVDNMWWMIYLILGFEYSNIYHVLM